MSRHKKDPLRVLEEEEREQLVQLSRSPAAPAAQVARAKALLGVSQGMDYTRAARHAGRVSGDAVSHLVSRFNQVGLSAVVPHHGGGSAPLYGAPERTLIVETARRAPERERDGTATWSLALLRRSLRSQGLSCVSADTIRRVLQEAGFSWQRSRTWCQTGTAQRRRKSGLVTVVDPDAQAKKKADRGCLPAGRSDGVERVGSG